MKTALVSAALIIGCALIGLVLVVGITTVFIQSRGGFGDMSGGALGPVIMLALMGAVGALVGALVGLAVVLVRALRRRNRLTTQLIR